MNDSERIFAGAMSGTSADGVDVAIMRVHGKAPQIRCELIKHHFRAFDLSLRQTIVNIRQSAHCDLRQLAQIGHEISLAYATGLNEALISQRMSADQLTAYACHGQTLYHNPPKTIQWLDPSLVSAEVGCPVVSDFRRADCAAGGQGAPLVPYADFLLFRDPEVNRVLLNIGGVSNITYLRAGGTREEVIAFDTGPGNCLSDHIMRTRKPDSIGYDPGGAIALSGQANLSIAYAFLGDSYFQMDPPKTTDTPSMIDIYMRIRSSFENITLPDELATAGLITAKCISEGIRSFTPMGLDEVIVSGGGTKNQAIIDSLRREMPSVSVRPIDELGIPSAMKEAIAFAILGIATIDNVPGNIPSATGAHRAVVLGSITPRP